MGIFSLFKKFFGLREEEEEEPRRRVDEEKELLSEFKEIPLSDVSGRFIGVLGVKGGAGKSTIASQLAILLGAIKGSVLIDLDIYNSTSSSLLIDSLLSKDALGKVDEYINDINTLLYISEYQGKVSKLLRLPTRDLKLPAHLVEALGINVLKQGNIRVLPGKPVDRTIYRRSLARLYSTKPELLREYVDTLMMGLRSKARKQLYPVVFDFPPYTGRKSIVHRYFLSYMDEIILVTSPEAESLHGLISMSSSIRGQVSLLIINRAPTREVCEENIEVCKMFLQVYRRAKKEYKVRVCNIPVDPEWAEAFQSRLQPIVFVDSPATRKLLKCLRNIYL